MKQAFPVVLAAVLSAATLPAAAQQTPSRIYRCGNTYTNSVVEAQAKGCKLVEGGNITVVEGTKVNPAVAGAAGTKVAVAPQAVSSTGPRVNSDEQRARDSDARAILEAELKKAEAKQQELLKEYNNGEPEKLGPEHKNYQKYLDRVAELKASIARNESDIAGLKRELGRLPAK